MSAGFLHPRCRGTLQVCPSHHEDPLTEDIIHLLSILTTFTVVSYLSGIVSEHSCVSEWICEWQLYLQHLMGVQIQSKSDLGVTSVSPSK